MISGFFILVLLLWCDSLSSRIKKLEQQAYPADSAPPKDGMHPLIAFVLIAAAFFFFAILLGGTP